MKGMSQRKTSKKTDEKVGNTGSCVDGEGTKTVDQRMIALAAVFVTLSCLVN